jgi:hypothetical protein
METLLMLLVGVAALCLVMRGRYRLELRWKALAFDFKPAAEKDSTQVSPDYALPKPGRLRAKSRARSGYSDQR